MNPDEEKIRNLIAEWHRATAAGEIDAVLELMSPDVVFLVPGKPPMRGREAFEVGLRELLKANQVISRGDVQEVEIAGDLAYSWTSLTVEIVPRGGGTASERVGNTLSIFRKRQNGSWVLTRDANLLPAGS